MQRQESASGSIVALRVEGLSLSFLNARNLVEVLLSISWIAAILAWLGLYRKSRTRKLVLQNLCFTVERGTIHGIFGVNSAGKSSLLNCIANLLVPQEGRVLVYGREVAAKTDFARRIISKCNRRELYGEFTAKQNIEFMARLYQLDPAAAWAVAQLYLDRLGVSQEDQQSNPVFRLSLGTQGKIALVRSLLPMLGEGDHGAEGPVLLLDEPTYGFDVASVEQFFKALYALKAEIPTLTVVLATNDPREAAYCEAYTALLGNRVEEDPARLERLKASMQHVRAALVEFAEIIGQTIEATPQSSVCAAPQRIPRSGPFAPIWAFWWRDLRDLICFPTLSFLVVATFVIPNLIGLFANAAGPGVDHWTSVAMCGLGIFATLVTRELLRTLDRERGYYRMLELVICSPVSPAKHFLATMSFGLLLKTIQSLLAVVCIGLLFWGDIGNGVRQSYAAMTWESAAGLACTAVTLTLFLIAIGVGLAVLSFIFHRDNAFFLLSLVPTMLVLCGGIYYQPSKLPQGIREVVEYNPLSHAAAALRHFGSLQPGDRLPTVVWLTNLFPGLSDGWACVLLLLCMSVVALLLGIVSFRYGKHLLHRLGRLRLLDV